jgi:hypothetical protein
MASWLGVKAGRSFPFRVLEPAGSLKLPILDALHAAESLQLR